MLLLVYDTERLKWAFEQGFITMFLFELILYTSYKVWYDAAHTYVYGVVKNFAHSYLEDQEFYDELYSYVKKIILSYLVDEELRCRRRKLSKPLPVIPLIPWTPHRYGGNGCWRRRFFMPSNCLVGVSLLGCGKIALVSGFVGWSYEVISRRYYNFFDLYQNETYAHPFDRENINDALRKGIILVLLTSTSFAFGFVMGAKWYERVFYVWKWHREFFWHI
jgi:hypothetical protein